MKCPNCGCEFDEGIFCPQCGTRVVVDNVSSESANVQPEQHEEAVAPEPVEDTTPITAPKEETPVREAASTASDIKQDEGPKKKEKASKPAKAPKEKKEKKKGGCLRPVLIVIAVIIVLLIIIMMIPTGSSSSSSSSTSGTTAAEDEGTDLLADLDMPEEEESWIPSFLDGISGEYEMNSSLMVDPYEVLDDFSNYDHVYLKSHEVKKSDNDGNIGTNDTIYLTVADIEPNELWYVEQDIQALYTYWGEEMGWKYSTAGGTLLSYSFAGLNGTYWRVIKGDDDQGKLYNLAYDLFGKGTGLTQSGSLSWSEYDEFLDNHDINIYFYLDGFDELKAKFDDAFSRSTLNVSYSDNGIIPSIKETLIIDNEAIERTVTPKRDNTISGGSLTLYLPEADFPSFYSDVVYNSSVKEGNIGFGGWIDYMTPITEEEYMSNIEKATKVDRFSSTVLPGNTELSDDEDDYDWNEFSMDEVDVDTENTSTFDPENVDYEKAYDYAFGQVGPSENGTYSLWDLNDDGIAELILGHGISNADYVNDIWTLDNNGNIKYVGMLDSVQAFYVAPDDNGIYAVYGHMEHEIIIRLTMSGDNLYTEIVSDRNLDMAAGEEYYSSEMRIAEADLDDKSLLYRWTISSGSSNNEYILSDSDSRYYSASELNGYTKDELRIARNEIYARHGRMFDSEDLNEYFNSKSWYNGTIPAAQFSEDLLNDYEKENAKTIQSVENSK